MYCRGSGKSFAAFDWLITRLLADPDPDATAIYYNKTYKQARAIATQILSRYTPLFEHDKFVFNKTTLCLTIASKKGHAKTLFLKSYEESESSRGFHPNYGVMDEAQEMSLDLYQHVIYPMFTPAFEKYRERAGLIFIGTPKGPNNILYELYNKGQDPNGKFYKSKLITIHNCELFSPETIKRCRASMSEKAFAQEFECDFNANVVSGAIYKDILDLYSYNNVGHFPVDMMYPVHMAWDLGYTHSTVAWFWQVINGEIRMVDYYESTNQDITKCLNEVLFKHYDWGEVILPHDANHHNIRSEYTITQIFQNHKLRVSVMKPTSVTAGIEAVKLLLRSLKWDEENTIKGRRHLEEYAYKITTTAGIDRANPDQSSPHADAADALRMMAISQNVWGTPPVPTRPISHFYECDVMSVY